jgi:hypothetical protein
MSAFVTLADILFAGSNGRFRGRTGHAVSRRLLLTNRDRLEVPAQSS